MTIKAEAIDFLEKSLEPDSFFHKIKSILKQNHDVNKLMNRFLTETKFKVLKLVIKDHSNKDIAYLQNSSKRTLQTRRAKTMKKICIDNFSIL